MSKAEMKNKGRGQQRYNLTGKNSEVVKSINFN